MATIPTRRNREIWSIDRLQKPKILQRTTQCKTLAKIT